MWWTVLTALWKCSISIRWKCSISNTFQLQQRLPWRAKQIGRKTKALSEVIVLRLFYRNGEDNWPPVQSAIIYRSYKYWRLCLSICVQQLNMSSVETFWKWTSCIAFLLFIIFNCEVDIFFTVRSHSLSFFRTQSINMINVSCFVHLTFHFLITAGFWHLLCLFITVASIRFGD